MDLTQAIEVLALINGVKKDKRDPIKLMPKSIKDKKLRHKRKLVDIPKTVENLFNNPSFICTDIKKFWENVDEKPDEYLMAAIKEFRTEIVYK